MTFIALVVASTFVFASRPAVAQATRLLTLQGEKKDEAFGTVAFVGDVTGDGFGDFMVGARLGDNEHGVDAGTVYLYSGRNASLLRTWHGDGAGETFGHAIKVVGDVNRDGFDDIGVAANSRGQSGLDQYVRVFSGRYLRHGELPEVLFTIHCDGVGDFGTHLDGGVDVDGDAYADILIGGASRRDAAFVYSGATQQLLFRMEEGGNSALGTAVAGLPDLNGDGFDDFAIGTADFMVGGEAETGIVRIHSGGSPLRIGRLLDELVGDDGSDCFGLEVERIGDVDQDSVPDFAVAAPGLENLGSSAGFVRVFSTITRAEIATLRGRSAGDFFGRAIGSGDLDGDSVLDLLVAAPYSDGAILDVGSVTALSGADWSILFEIEGDAKDDELGRVAAGDLDGDGRAEAIVGAAHVDRPGALRCGAAYIASTTDAPASWHNYDEGFPGRLGVPSFVAIDDPVFGSTIELVIANSSGAATTGVVLIGSAPATIPSSRGGTILVDVSITVPIAFPDGSEISMLESIPFDLALSGASLYMQALALDAWSAKGVSFSAGLELVLGGTTWQAW